MSEPKSNPSPLDPDVLDCLKQSLAGADSWLAVETTLRRAVPEEEEERFRAFVFAFGYMLHHDEERRAEEGPFGAAIVTEQGQFPPPLADVPGADVEAWRGATDQTEDPVALSRLHDLLWERREGDRPDLHARAAIDAYLLVSENQAWPSIERVDCLTRALELARAVADPKRQEGVVVRIVKLARDDLVDEDGGPGVALTLLGAVAGLDSRPEELPELVKAANEHYGGDPYIADTLIDLRIRLAPGERERLRREQVERWRRAAAEGDGMLRSIRLQRALELAKTHGLKDLIETLRLQLQEMQPRDFDLKSVSAEIQIPAEKVRALIDSIVDEEGWERSLVRFGIHGPPGGEPDALDRRIDELKRAAPLQFLVTKVVISSDETTTIFRADDDESHRRLARAEQRSQHARFWSIFAADALDAIRERHGEPSREQLTEFFTTELIDAPVAERFGRAVELFLDGQADEAAHLITPRIEAVVRELARRIGIPIVREPSGAIPGRVQSLGPILDQLRPFFAQPGWHAYLGNLLTDQLGLNLRNVVSHGLRDQIDRGDTALLIQAACYLRSLALTSRQEESDGTG